MNKASTKFIVLFLLFLKIKIHFLKEINNVTLLEYNYCCSQLNKKYDRRTVFYIYLIKNNLRTSNGKKKTNYKKKCISIISSTNSDDNRISEKKNLENKYISQDFNGISIYPLNQKGEENALRTKIPAKEFKPKRSLGQNYLRDENIIRKMVDAIEMDINDNSVSNDNKTNTDQKKEKKEKGKKKKGNHKVEMIENTVNVNKKNQNNIEAKSKCENLKKYNFESIKNNGNGIIELGCGLGQISKFLFKKYHKMTGVEIDSRALSIISRTMPGFDFIHDDVLQINYKELSINKKTKLTVIGNLPFYITSQILFCLLDFCKYIDQAVITIQYEVGQRIIAKPNSKNYSILSILFSLYSKPYLLFKIPSKAFYPVPKVEAAVMKIIFKTENLNCNLLYLKQVLRHSFQQKRKKLKSSLKPLIDQYKTPQIPPSFAHLRPQQLYPYQFIELTNFLFPLNLYPFNQTTQTKVWRKKKHGEY